MLGNPIISLSQRKSCLKIHPNIRSDCEIPEFYLHEIIENLDYPCLFHCKSGADRAGFMSALYFIYKKNDLQKAIKQLDFKYGHVKKSKTGVLDLFFSEYKYFLESGKKLNFNNWVVKIYDKDKIQRKHQYSNTLNIILDFIMRRE